MTSVSLYSNDDILNRPFYHDPHTLDISELLAIGESIHLESPIAVPNALLLPAYYRGVFCLFQHRLVGCMSPDGCMHSAVLPFSLL